MDKLINTGLAVLADAGTKFRQVMLITVSEEGSVQVWNPNAGADPIEVYTLRSNNRLIHIDAKADDGFPRLVIRADIRAEYPQLWTALVEP